GSFCSGFDLSSKHSSSSTSSGENTFFTTAYALQMTALMHKNMLKLHRMDLVSIAAVDGFALGGGCELMAWCDLRVMSKEAKAGFLQTKMGVVTGWGGATRLRTMVSPSHALQLLSSPRIMNSKECFESKLATHIGDANSASSMDIVERDVFNRDWVDAYPLAIRNMKKLTQCGIAGDGIDLEKMLANEQRVFCGLWGGKDNIEAVANSKMKQPIKNIPLMTIVIFFFLRYSGYFVLAPPCHSFLAKQPQRESYRAKL
ncbi:ClpP/crotonase-like domain-containing protein, partial [Obelidium mucronatum]